MRSHREYIVDKIGVLPVFKLIRVTGWAHSDMLHEVETGDIR